MSTNILKSKGGIFTSDIVKGALWAAIKKFHPVVQMKNPVIFIVTLGALFCTGIVIRDAVYGSVSPFVVQITLWLYFTTFFANFAEAIAEGAARRGPMRCATPRRMLWRVRSSMAKRNPFRRVSS